MLSLLLQWADSAYPTGGFAYSTGLESMARFPAFRKIEDLKAYLNLVLRQSLSMDLPYLAAMREAAVAGNESRFAQWAWEWDACLHQPSIRHASLAQGEAWLRLRNDAPAGLAGPEFPQAIRVEAEIALALPRHFLPVLAWIGGHSPMIERDMRSLYLHLLLRDQVAAAVRLGLIGANQAQRLQKEVGPIGHPEWISEELAPPEAASRCAPVLEIVQALHPDMYVRLFQN